MSPTNPVVRWQHSAQPTRTGEGHAEVAATLGDSTDKPLSDRRRAFVAAYVGECRMNATCSARVAGYTHPNKQGPALLVDLGIKQAIDEYRAEIKRQGIAHQQNRVDAINKRHQLLEQIVAERSAEYVTLAVERAADPTPQTDLDRLLGRRSVPAGGSTGLLVRKVKAVGDMIAEEFAVDTGLLDQLSGHEADMAKELGERVDKREYSGPNGGAIPLDIVGIEVPLLPAAKDDA